MVPKITLLGNGRARPRTWVCLLCRLMSFGAHVLERALIKVSHGPTQHLARSRLSVSFTTVPPVPRTHPKQLLNKQVGVAEGPAQSWCSVRV